MSSLPAVHGSDSVSRGRIDVWLEGWGAGDEPLHWQPPDDWVTATAWPGPDPARTDPAPIHHALLNKNAPPAQIAADLGISLGHLRQVLRWNPLPRPRPRRPVRRTLIPATEPATRPSGQQPGVIYLDPAWLRQEYRTWHRSLDDIAAQVGCTIQTLNRFARDHAIPVRTRGTSTYMPASSAPGLHSRDLPEPLRSALIGPRARAAWTGSWSSPATPASSQRPRNSASGRPASMFKSPGSSAPAADRSSTAGAPQAPRS